MDIAREAFVDGTWRPTARRFPVRDPFDDTVIAEVADSDDALIDEAVAASVRAFATWRRRRRSC